MLRIAAALSALTVALVPAHRQTACAEQPKPEPESVNRLAAGLWFAHRYAKPEALKFENDRRLKVKLISVFAKAAELTESDAAEIFDAATFRQLAGDSKSITVEQMASLLRKDIPESRKQLLQKVCNNADLLTTQFDMINSIHAKGADELVTWIVKNYQSGKPLELITMCTGNTRRSMMSAAMGNMAAAYYGLDGIRFYSGGIEPDAMNPRTITTLKDFGFEIEPTGKEAERGKKDHPNPIYSVKWGKNQETREFSKRYTIDQNPQKNFAAILVCSEADDACPTVTGAAARIPVNFIDAKAYDGTPFEAAKYSERRDDIGRFMLSVMMQARRKLEIDGKLK